MAMSEEDLLRDYYTHRKPQLERLIRETDRQRPGLITEEFKALALHPETAEDLWRIVGMARVIEDQLRRSSD
jgi:hypothetical protein